MVVAFISWMAAGSRRFQLSKSLMNFGFDYIEDHFCNFDEHFQEVYCVYGSFGRAGVHYILNRCRYPDSSSVGLSMVFITPVDIPSLIKDFQKIVVELNESDVINLSLSHAHRVADLIQRRSGDAPLRHIPGQDFETEHKESRIKQLRDLDSENRQLRQLYEDSQWTLHLVMEAHRRELDAHFCQDGIASASSSETKNDVELDTTRKQFHQNAAIMARGVNEVFQHEQRMKEAFAKRMEELEMENEVLRCVLESQPGVDANTILQQLERRMASSTPSPGDISMNSSGEYECREQHDEEATPVKKPSAGQRKLDVT